MHDRMMHKITHKEMEFMPSVAKKLVIVHNDEPAPERAAETVDVTNSEAVEVVGFIDAEMAEGSEDSEAELRAIDGAVETGEGAQGYQVSEGSERLEASEASDAAEGGAPVKRLEELRLLEALLFAAAEPLDEATLARQLPEGVNVKNVLAQLKAEYSTRGVNLVRIGRKWTFRTAEDLAWLLTKQVTETRKLSRAAIETLAIVAYHQPVTRAEIEEVRGVATAAGTLDVLLKTGWIRPRGRRKAPGRPITNGTTEAFLTHFGLEEVSDLPGLDELKGSGLLEGNMPSGFTIPMPSDDATLREDEDPLEPGDLDLGLAPAPEAEAAAEFEAEAKADELAAAQTEAAQSESAQSESEPDEGEK
jgi:segregation and condensation protein B